MLINGDFKINQRGQTTYYANGTSWLYTVDMWRINNHSKLYVNEGYVRFHKVDSDQQALLNQVVKTKGKSITVIKVKEINGTATVRFGDSTVTKTITQSGIFTIKNNTPISSVAIDLVTNGHYIDIEYIDLFEGSIAYKHVEEDDTIALMRCQNWVIWGEIPSNAPSNINTTTGVIEARVSFPRKMKSVPTVKVYDLQNNEDKITRVNIGFDSANNSVVSGIVPRNTGFVVTSSGTYKANVLSGYYLATREPL